MVLKLYEIHMTVWYSVLPFYRIFQYIFENGSFGAEIVWGCYKSPSLESTGDEEVRYMVENGSDGGKFIWDRRKSLKSDHPYFII